MRRAAGIGAGLILAIGALAIPPAAGAAEERILELSARLEPRPGLDVRGLVVLRAGSDGAGQARGMLLGLRTQTSDMRPLPLAHAAAVPKVRLAISSKPCDQLSKELSGTLIFGGYGVDVDDGTSLIDGEGPPYHKLRRAGCLAVVGDWDGDGRDTIGAVGPPTILGLVGTDSGFEGTTALRFTGFSFGDPNFLTYGTAGPQVPQVQALVASKLDPNTDHTLALSEQTCHELEDERGRRMVGLTRFETDAQGTAFTNTTFDDEGEVAKLRRAGSMVIARLQGKRLQMVACAQLHVAPVHLDLLGA